MITQDDYEFSAEQEEYLSSLVAPGVSLFQLKEAFLAGYELAKYEYEPIATKAPARPVCAGDACPSKPDCLLAVKPDNKHDDIKWNALYIRREDGAAACDMFQSKEQP